MRRMFLTLLTMAVLFPAAAQKASAEQLVFYFYTDRVGTCAWKCALPPICCPCKVEIPFPLIL